MGLIFSLVAGAVAIGAGVLIPAIDFTANGIAAGSIAAGIQSGIGNVVAGSAFAAMQSVAQSGALGAISTAAGTASLATGALALAEAPQEGVKEYEHETEGYPIFDSLTDLSEGSKRGMKIKSTVPDL